MDVLGKGYVIEHCVSFFHKRQKDFLFRNYVADALKHLVYNTGKHNDFVTINASYNELVNSLNRGIEEEEEKTADQVINDIRNKIGGM